MASAPVMRVNATSSPSGDHAGLHRARPGPSSAEPRRRHRGRRGRGRSGRSGSAGERRRSPCRPATRRACRRGRPASGTSSPVPPPLGITNSRHVSELPAPWPMKASSVPSGENAGWLAPPGHASRACAPCLRRPGRSRSRSVCSCSRGRSSRRAPCCPGSRRAAGRRPDRAEVRLRIVPPADGTTQTSVTSRPGSARCALRGDLVAVRRPRPARSRSPAGVLVSRFSPCRRRSSRRCRRSCRCRRAC